ncbi:MAG: GNAT family N-acetyltransferase [Lachnospiraceae bacterium]|nr:GNAT family N-acetyltransferase [Lachnospiraceae bacterium]
MADKAIKIFNVTADEVEAISDLLTPEITQLMEAGIDIPVIGALLGDDLAGAAAGIISDGCFEIISLYVLPEYRRKRVGRALIKTFENMLEDEQLFLRSQYTLQSEDNETLAPFFEFMGFYQEENDTPGYYLTPLKDFNVTVKASEALKYDIRYLFELSETEIRACNIECNEKEMPLPDTGLIRADKKHSVISFSEGQVNGYAIAEHAGGVVRLSGLWSETKDLSELTAMLSFVEKSLKTDYIPKTRVLLVAYDNETYSVVNKAAKRSANASFGFIKEPEGSIS